MDITAIVIVAFSLAADCFAVALGGSAAIRQLTRLHVVRVSAAFGFAQFLMPVFGWLFGKTIVNLISAYDHWIALCLLGIVGTRMIWEAYRGEEGGKKTDITRGVMLLTLSIATSIDSMAVGLSFALLETNIILSALIIGIVAFFVTAAGFWLGRKAGMVLGKWAKLAGGVVLIAIGLKILINHLTGG